MPKKGHTSFFRTLILAVAAAALAPAGFAQLTNTGIHGSVEDPSGAMIPNAGLTLKDTSTGIEKRTTAAKDGGFVFPDLVAGTYAITSAASGFDMQIMENVVVDAGRTTSSPQPKVENLRGGRYAEMIPPNLRCVAPMQ